MSNRLVRSIRNVNNVDNQPLWTTEENDLLSDKQGNVYIRVQRGYKKLAYSEDVDTTSIKSEQTKLKNRVKSLEDELAQAKQDIETLKSSLPTEDTESEG